MREERQENPNKIVLTCGAAENAKIANQDHMHQVTYTFLDADHIKTDWVLYKGGKADSTHSFELARKKADSTKQMNSMKPMEKKTTDSAKKKPTGNSRVGGANTGN